MFDPGETLSAALAGPHQPCSRIAVLSSLTGAETEAWEGAAGILEAASVSCDRSRHIRRTAEVTLVNRDGALSPQRPGDLFHPGSYVRLERGAIISGHRSYLPMMTGVVAAFRAGMDGRLSLHIEDPFYLLAQPFGEVVVIAAGTGAADALRTVWEPVLGDGSGWSLDADGRTVATRVFLEDEDRLSAVVAWMADLGLEVYADRLGLPTLQPIPDPSTAAAVTVVKDFRADPTILSLERSGDRLAYNRTIVETSPTDGSEPVRAIAEVTDPTSPIHEDRIGLRTAPVYRSAQVTDQAAANAVAKALLVEYSLVGDSIGGTAIPDPTLDEGDVVTVGETVSGADDRYRIERITHPVTTGALSFEATKVLPLFLLEDAA